MSSYYDSDDDVAWGPLTLREIKRTLQNPVSKKINRRHTLQATTGAANDSKEQLSPLKMEEPITNNSSSVPKDLIHKCNTTSSSNEYYTPNVTIAEKHTDPVVNSPIVSVKHNLGVSSNVNVEETQIKFLDLANNRDTDFDLKNIQQTLVECTVLDDSSESRGNSDEMHDSCIMKSFESSEHSQHFENDIIVVSSDEDNDSFLTANTKSYQNGAGNYSLVKTEIIDLEESFHKDYGYLISDGYSVDNLNQLKQIVDTHDDFQSDYSEENISTDSILKNQDGKSS